MEKKRPLLQRVWRRQFFRFCCIMGLVAPTPGMRVFFNRLKGCRIGPRTWIGSQVFLDVHLDHPDPHNSIIIGEHVSVGQNVMAFTHDSSYWQITDGRRPIKFGRVEIGDHTYIGPGAVIFDSRIGAHCIVLTQSVIVSREFPDYSLIAGFPARVIKDLRPEVMEASGDRDTV